MRMIFAALAAPGHVYPLVPLALAARDAGHDVVFATGEQFLPSLRKAGLDVAVAGPPIGEAFLSLHDGPRRAFPPEQLAAFAARVFGDILPRRVVADLRPILADGRPDLVVHEVGNVGAGLAAKVAGIPAVCHGYGRESRTMEAGPTEDLQRSFAAELGVELSVSYPATVGNRYLDICPPSLQSAEFVAAVDRVGLRPVAWNEPGELPAGIRDRSRPLVYLTLGTAMGDADVFRPAIAGLAGLPVEVLVAAGPHVDTTALGEVPDNVRLESWVPQGELLAHVDLVVHHGGSGTMLGSLAAGKPQLLLPRGADQFTNAEAIVEAGAGERLLGADLSVEAVAELARGLLADEAVRAVAHRFSVEIAGMPSPDEVAHRLPEFA